MQIERVKIADLVKYEENAKLHPQEQIDNVSKKQSKTWLGVWIERRIRFAKYATKSGYKNLDKKTKGEVKAIIKEYSKNQNPRLYEKMKKENFDWYKYE